MHQFVDIFTIPEISLISQVIEFFQSNAIAYDPEYVFWDVRVSPFLCSVTIFVYGQLGYPLKSTFVAFSCRDTHLFYWLV